MTSLVARSVLAVALPLAVCLFLGLVLGTEWRSHLLEARRVVYRAEVEVPLGRLAHALETERAASTAFVGGVTAMHDHLLAARRRTDECDKELRRQVEALERPGRSPAEAELLQRLDALLAPLPGFRRQIDETGLDSEAVRDGYTRIVIRLIDLTDELTLALGTPEFVAEFEVYRRVLLYRERSTRELGYGTALLGTPGADEKLRTLYRASMHLRQEALRELRYAAPGSVDRRVFEVIRGAPYLAEIRAFRERLEEPEMLDAADDRSALAWFDASVARSEYIRQELEQVAQQIRDDARAHVRSVEARFIGLLSTLAILLVFLVWVSTKLSRELVGHLQAEERYAARARHLALHDYLTDLPNRYHFEEILEEARKLAAQEEYWLALHLVDIIDFSRVNRIWGNQAGDGTLKAVAERLLRRTSGVGRVGRIHGDQFGVIQPLTKRREEAEDLAWALLAEFENPIEFEGRLIRVRARIGITLFPPDGKTSEVLLRNADLAKQHVRRGGAYRFYVSDMYEFYLASKRLEEALRNSVVENEFTVRYQPKLSLSTNRVSGVEALARWQHPERGLLEPKEFMQEAEQSGTIVEIGSYVLEQACRQICSWQDLGIQLPVMSVNLSAVQLRQANLVETLAEIIERTGVDPRFVELEITESVLMEDIQETLGTLNALRGLGVRLAIDDFGTGHSSLTYLLRFPVTTLKIDQSFIAALTSSRESDVIVDAVVQLGRSLHLQVVAEGVETKGQLELLKRMGCDEVQGYLVARPLTPSEMTGLLQAQGA